MQPSTLFTSGRCDCAPLHFCTGGPVLKGGDSCNANCHVGRVSLSEAIPISLSQRGACVDQGGLGSCQELGPYWSASCPIAGFLLSAGRSLRSGLPTSSWSSPVISSRIEPSILCHQYLYFTSLNIPRVRQRSVSVPPASSLSNRATTGR